MIGPVTDTEPPYPSKLETVASPSAPNLKLGRAVRMLMTPAEVFLPNKVPCGPFNTSIRCSSPMSPKPTELRGR